MNMQAPRCGGTDAGDGCGERVEADQRGCFEYYNTVSPLS